ncbi:MAG: hypothetical protein Q4D52_02230 [Eubacteriales bacterium]|nr:hypothetical protein [Eubacteriales bacterium]
MFLIIITLLLGFHGLYEFYSKLIDNPFKLISAVLYGNIKLFLFAPPVGPEADTTLSYELSKWLAPILTSALIFTRISNYLFHLKNSLINRFSRNPIIIFERNSFTDILIHNLTGYKKPYKISLVTKTALDDELKKKYEKAGVSTYQSDFKSLGRNELKELSYNLNINRAKYIILTSDNDLENYVLFSNITKTVRPKGQLACLVNCNSNVVAAYLEDIISEERQKNKALKQMDVMTFDENDLVVRLLMGKVSISNKTLGKICGDLKNISRSGQNPLTVEQINDHIANMHYVIVGINELTLYLLKHLANDSTVKLGVNTKVTLIDDDAQKGLETILENNESLKLALELNPIDLNGQKKRFIEAMKMLRAEGTATAMFFLYTDTIANLGKLKIADRYLQAVPKALRNVSGIDIKSILSKENSHIRVFGDLSEVMTQEILLREALDQRAKKFNDYYNHASSLADMGSGKAWNELSRTKKSSSRSSASHGVVKEAMLKQLFPERSPAEIRKYIDEKFAEFQHLQEYQKADNEAFKTGFREFLQQNPILDFLSRLEHKRWCNTYYAMNFTYGEKKDEEKKTHPCLIDDWNVVVGEKFDICHPEYDLLSVFTLFQEEV